MHNFFPNFDNIIFFDVETTGLNPMKDQIIEFAAMKFTKEGACDETHFYIQLENGRTLPEEITELTGIYTEWLEKRGICMEEAMTKIKQVLFGPGTTNLLIAHNANFDMRFVLKMMSDAGFDKLCTKSHVLDSLTVARDRKEHPCKLKDMITHYHITGVENSHRAIDDVFALAKVVHAMGTECNDLDLYVNLFGMYPRFPTPEAEKILGITYVIQNYEGGKNRRLYLIEREKGIKPHGTPEEEVYGDIEDEYLARCEGRI
ncbi:3'-5' exonuclease [Methanorbis rubei]|uniref:DNA polymerase III PolC-type n=1 Tax=Methanorbis rubei TaxID=3028300 RepID=A0AAE4MIJ6_9EURY|nr:DNA polymerase III PolC-type [Methanocorpusculaceae archaeon Cs1]